MKLLADVFSSITRRNSKAHTKQSSDFVFYKIVGYKEKEEVYTLQCINTSAVFRAPINNIVEDIDILYGLHPIQACYIGVEYAKFLKTNSSNVSAKTRKSKKEKNQNYNSHRYGNYFLHYQDRGGALCFENLKTKERFLMDACDIAISEDLIKEFDAVQAFHIGLLAGELLDKSMAQKIQEKQYKHLRLIK